MHHACKADGASVAPIIAICSWPSRKPCKLPRHIRCVSAEFDTVTYKEIHDDLSAKDAELYGPRGNNLLSMLERNMQIKPRPQRWQNNR